MSGEKITIIGDKSTSYIRIVGNAKTQCSCKEPLKEVEPGVWKCALGKCDAFMGMK